DPTVWRDVFLANRDAVLEMLGRFNEDVSALTKAIRKGDGDALFEQFERTRAIPRALSKSVRIHRLPISGVPTRTCRMSPCRSLTPRRRAKTKPAYCRWGSAQGRPHRR